METLVSWCADCSREAVFDAVPDALPAEYLCRGCNAAALVEDAPMVSPLRMSAVA